MNRRLDEVLKGKEDNYLLPFYWQHGNHHEKIPEQIERIYRSGCRAFCVESRTHKDFCKDGWWYDMDLIISEAKKRGMKVWIFDDDHYPTGHAAGSVKDHPELKQRFLIEQHIDVLGPAANSLLRIEKHGGDVLLGVFAFKRTGVKEATFGDPIDLSGCVRGDFLRFDIPEGCWRVFYYYETTRSFVRPDYIDMLNPESVKLLVDTVYQPHFEHYKDEFGKTLAGFFSDEPCLGNAWFGQHTVDLGFYNHRVGQPGLALPFRSDVPELMRSGFGKNALPYLAGLWFDIGDKTPAVRHAYMDTVTKLYRDCFTRQLGDWCEAHGVQYIGHIIEDMNAHARLSAAGGHYFRSLDGQHMSGIDIVLHQIIPGMYDYIHTGWAFGSNADPEFYDVVLGKLAASLAHIGTQMDGRAMCEVFGAYGWAEGTPMMKWLIDFLLVRGVNRFIPHAFSPDFPDPDCPPHFGADDKDPQFEGFTKIMNYTNRAAHLLSGMTHKANAAILYHADAEWMNFEGGAMMLQEPAKVLYDDQIDFDILPVDCFISGTGSRVYRASASNGKLACGDETYDVLVIPYAEYLPKKFEKALRSLEAEGVKVVRVAKDFDKKAFLKEVRSLIRKDITVKGTYKTLRAIHFYDKTSDVYMFSNESVREAVSTTVKLSSVKGSRPYAVLDMLNDGMWKGTSENGTITLDLLPYQSCIIIFDKSGLPEGLKERKTVKAAADAKLKFDVSLAHYTAMDSFEPYAKAVPCEKLPKLSSDDKFVEFSGKFRYTAKFDLKDLGGASAVDLGEVGMTAHVWVNGCDLGVRVCNPYRYDLSDALKKGANEIVIEVSNTLANAVRDPFTQYLAIPRSGLLGPVKWLTL
ncbi:MAG: glycosyl transferase family 2 [Clostridia bacterium]|nr:glycosyl transferase family 2 [Clostridia bacterium]